MKQPSKNLRRQAMFNNEDIIEIQQSETLRLKVTVQEAGAETAELYAYTSTGNVITVTAPFVGLEADISTSNTNTAGEYEYYVRITWDDGTNDIVPDTTNCYGDDCKRPIIKICPIEEPA